MRVADYALWNLFTLLKARSPDLVPNADRDSISSTIKEEVEMTEYVLFSLISSFILRLIDS